MSCDEKNKILERLSNNNDFMSVYDHQYGGASVVREIKDHVNKHKLLEKDKPNGQDQINNLLAEINY